MTLRLAIGNSVHASLALPCTLLIVDYDTLRFTLEGPVDDPLPWEKEVARMRRSGRDVAFCPSDAGAAGASARELTAGGFEEWPPHSIVHFAPERPDASAELAPQCEFRPDFASSPGRKSVARRRRGVQVRALPARG